MSAKLNDFVNYNLRYCSSKNRYSVDARITSLSSILGISPFVFLETKLKREYLGTCSDIRKHLFLSFIIGIIWFQTKTAKYRLMSPRAVLDRAKLTGTRSILGGLHLFIKRDPFYQFDCKIPSKLTIFPVIRILSQCY